MRLNKPKKPFLLVLFELELEALFLDLLKKERLFDLGRMVHIDHQLGDRQEKLLEKLGIALGFTPENICYVVNKALSLIDKKVDLDTFIYEMKNMYK